MCKYNLISTEEFEFQTVAVVPRDLTQMNLPPDERFKRLRNGGFCHPGFSRSQWWNDYILKHFENTVNSPKCQNDVSVIENEVRNLRNFFGKACRPGEWAADSTIDQELSKSIHIRIYFLTLIIYYKFLFKQEQTQRYFDKIQE